jgi:hypothetical protein
MNRTLSKLFRKASSLHGVFNKRMYKELKKTYVTEPNSRNQVRRFIREKQLEQQLESQQSDNN